MENLPSNGKNSKSKAKSGGNKLKAPKIPVLQRAVINALNGKSDPLFTLPAPKIKLAAYLPPKGSKQIVCLKDAQEDVWEHVDEDFVVDQISYYLRSLSTGVWADWFEWEHRHIKSCAKKWLCETFPTEQPAAYRFKSEPGRCFSRVPFDIGEVENLDTAPIAKELVARMSNAEAVCQWIGSIFNPGSYRETYLWVVGRGRDGKGALLSGILRVLGGASFSLQIMPEDNHWAINFEHRRLVAFTDLEDASILNSSRFKSLTGGDLLTVRPLFRPPYNAAMDCLIWINSNHMPDLRNQPSSLERIIFSQISPPDRNSAVLSSDYTERLWAEMPILLSYCNHLYRTKVNHGEKVQSDAETVEELKSWACSAEEEFEVLLEQFEVGPDYLTQPAQMQGILKTQWPHDKERRRRSFLEWLRLGHGIKRTNVRCHDEWGNSEKPAAAYRGLKPKGPFKTPAACIHPARCHGVTTCLGPAFCPRRNGTL